MSEHNCLRCQALLNECDSFRKKILIHTAEIERLKEALQALYDEQNGPPLIRDQKDWEFAMALAEKALKQESEK